METELEQGRKVVTLADEIASHASLFHEGDVGELVIATEIAPSPENLRRIREGLSGTDAKITAVYSNREGTHVQFKVGVLPLFAIALIAAVVLVPLIIIGWKLIQLPTSQMVLVMAALAIPTVLAIIFLPKLIPQRRMLKWLK